MFNVLYFLSCNFILDLVGVKVIFPFMSCFDHAIYIRGYTYFVDKYKVCKKCSYNSFNKYKKN